MQEDDQLVRSMISKTKMRDVTRKAMCIVIMWLSKGVIVFVFILLEFKVILKYVPWCLSYFWKFHGHIYSNILTLFSF